MRRSGQAPVGRQWFALTFRDPNERWTGVNKAAPLLNKFLDAELARHSLPATALTLVGFSQGTMMSLFVGPRRAAPVAGIVGFSGRLLAPELLASELRSRPPILLVHGTEDPLVPYSSLAAAETALEAAGVPVETVTSVGIGHSIDDEGLRRGGQFLRNVLSGTTP